MSFLEKPRWAIFGKQQHPLAHDLSDMYYANPRLPNGMTNPSDVLDYIISVLYPNYIGTYATPAALPVSPAANSYAIVTDDGDGKSAGYVYQSLDGVSQWMKRYDVDWSMDNILAETVNRTQYMYVHKYGMSDKDSSGTEITGILAGQTIFGGDKVNQNLILNANSFDDSGYIVSANGLIPLVDNTFSLGISGKAWMDFYTSTAFIGQLSISTDEITSNTGQVSFTGANLVSVNDITANSLNFPTISFTETDLIKIGANSTFTISAMYANSNLALQATNGVRINKLLVDQNISGYSNILIESLNAANPKITSSTGTTQFAGNILVGSTVSASQVSSTTSAFSTRVVTPEVRADVADLTLRSDNGYVVLNAVTASLGINLNIAGSPKVSVTSSLTQLNSTVTQVGGILQTDRIEKAGTAATNLLFEAGHLTSGRIFRPSTDNSLDLGTAALRWAKAYISNGISDGTNTITTATLMSLKDINTGVATNMALFWDGTKWAPSYADLEVDHHNISNLTTGDDHTQYLLLAGRSGGQTLYGGTGSGDNLFLDSTSNATKGKIFVTSHLVPLSASTYDLGNAGYKWRDITMTGQLLGARLENVTAPSFSASTVGRVYWNTSTGKLQVDTGISILDIGPGLTNPMTTGGDLIYGGSSGTPTRLANGTLGQFLQSNGSTVAPSWASLPVAGATTQVIFNNAGAYAGSSSLVWDNTNFRLGIGAAASTSIHIQQATAEVRAESTTNSNASIFSFSAKDSAGTARTAKISYTNSTTTTSQSLVLAIDTVDKLKIFSGGLLTMIGAHNPTGATTLNSSSPSFYSGTYTPTFTAVNAIAANTMYAMQYMRVGSVVTVSGKVDITPTGAATVSFNITVPVAAANFTNNQQAAGAGTFENGVNAYIVVRMTGDVGTSAMRVAFIAPSNTAGTIFLTFTYQVV